MKNFLTLASTLAILLSATVAHANFYDGTWLNAALLKDEKARKEKVPAADAQEGALAVGYVIGIVDGFEAAQLLCVPDKVTVEQVIAMVQKTLKESPDKWNQPADVLVLQALKPAWTCKK